MKRRAVTTGLLVLPVVALLGFAGALEMGGHGVAAALLGSLVTLALAGVLVWLMVHRRDHEADR